MSPKKEIGDPLERVAQTGKIGGLPGAAKRQNANAVLAQNDNTSLPQSSIAVKEQSGNTVLPQNDNTGILQSHIEAIPQKRTKTDERVKLTFYVDPKDVRLFDDLRYQYNRQHGTRLDQNKFMRLIMKRLNLDMLEEETEE